jgi:tight adherence protein C
MTYMISIATFFTITLLIYGLLQQRRSEPALEERLGGLRHQRPARDPLPDPDAAFGARVIRPMVTGMARKVNSMLPASIEERLADSIIQAGLKIKPGQFILIVGVTAGLLPLLMVALMAAGGYSPKMLMIIWGVMLLFGLYAPRIWLKGRISRRQKAIWRSLPDAFDLITASVEAGLGIDAALNRVIEKVKGPFAEELTRTMREITMGRARREALQDMAARTGVEELRSFVNSIVQAESMGVSIGTVIRVQTGVIRTKRRQKAEEAAFKAPIKMVFPLVFFVFPTIMVVIGGPAVIQMRDAFTK